MMFSSPFEAMHLAQRLATTFGELPQVEAVTLGGSLASGSGDASSDIDLYVYTHAEISTPEREAIVARSGGASRADIGLTYWGPGDEWFQADSGIEVDVVYFDTGWMETQICLLLDEHRASMGYSTCFWYTVLYSESLYDQEGWFAKLQTRCKAPYPEALSANIISRNLPVLRTVIPAYLRQIEKATRRHDLVSINHRLAALFASYFDIIFAANRVLHPGEKRLLEQAQRLCASLPDHMTDDVMSVLHSSGSGDPELLAQLNRMIDRLEEWLTSRGVNLIDLPGLFPSAE
ncbi:MAG: DUF4037 domain-containing protein [Anaerolineae bacterium]|nr:DUF4037 domain-containing protein [Anaerolineae bacterium]